MLHGDTLPLFERENLHLYLFEKSIHLFDLYHFMKPFKSQDMVKILVSHGWVVDHMTGSHAIMYHEGTKKRTTVPIHRKELAVGTLMAILRQTGISKQDLLDF